MVKQQFTNGKPASHRGFLLATPYGVGGGSSPQLSEAATSYDYLQKVGSHFRCCSFTKSPSDPSIYQLPLDFSTQIPSGKLT